MVILMAIIVVTVVALGVISAVIHKKPDAPVEKPKSSKPLSAEEKIIALNAELSAGRISKEEYKAKKAEILKNL